MTEYLNNTQSDLLYSSHSMSGHQRAKILQKRLELNLPTFAKEINAIYDKRKLEDLQKALSDKGLIACHMSTCEGNFIDQENFQIINIEPDDSTVDFYIYGDSCFIDDCIKTIEDCGMHIYDNYMQWYYNDKGYSVKLPIHDAKQPCSEMYPFLGEETLEEYYDRFAESDSSILLLIGPPGTGKTTFLKGLLNHTRSSASISYNLDVLNDDSIFVNFLTGQTQHMIMEDCDTFLEQRTDGNNMMHRFLNVSDGLVSVKGKKIIFTTNLENTNHIDEALIRPGRCFDILYFDHLTPEQAKKLADKYEIELKSEKERYTIADVFAGGLAHEEDVKEHQQERKVGFC